MKLEHVAINVPDAKSTCHWFAEQLDLRIVVANDQSPFIHFLSDGAGSMIELYSNPIAPVPNYPEVNPYNLHFAFATDDIDADIARLLASGATQVADIELTARGDKLVFMREPSGVPFQLVQRSSPLGG